MASYTIRFYCDKCTWQRTRHFDDSEEVVTLVDEESEKHQYFNPGHKIYFQGSKEGV